MQYESGMLSLESEIEDLYAVNARIPVPPPSSRISEPGGTKGVIDTGATVSAGGQKAVQELVTGLAAVRPDLEGEDNAR